LSFEGINFPWRRADKLSALRKIGSAGTEILRKTEGAMSGGSSAEAAVRGFSSILF
jgi:hypothetical protein